ncbi:hypothetical protein [Halopiger djelfimassiliensis]|nr:hypothetical protein [Halopiger djelfimassiliensis]
MPFIQTRPCVGDEPTADNRLSTTIDDGALARDGPLGGDPR